jgi:hypothetical protein
MWPYSASYELHRKIEIIYPREVSLHVSGSVLETEHGTHVGALANTVASGKMHNQNQNVDILQGYVRLDRMSDAIANAWRHTTRRLAISRL